MYTHLISKPYKKGKQKKTKKIRIVSTENHDNFLWTLVIPDNERVDSKNMISNHKTSGSVVVLFFFSPFYRLCTYEWCVAIKSSK